MFLLLFTLFSHVYGFGRILVLHNRLEMIQIQMAPDCHECLFYDAGRCLKSGRTSMYEDIMLQNITYERTETCREKDGLCGPNGVFFLNKTIYAI